MHSDFSATRMFGDLTASQRALQLANFTEEEIALIARSNMPAGFEHLDAELEGWSECPDAR